MKFRPFALLACLTLALAACSEDPTAEGSGEPEAIVTDFSERHVALNSRATIVAYTIDQNFARIPGRLDASPAGPAVAVDSVTYNADLQETTIFIRAASASAAGTDLTVTGHGLTKTVKIVI
jgi:hypothetical protein